MYLQTLRGPADPFLDPGPWTLNLGASGLVGACVGALGTWIGLHVGLGARGLGLGAWVWAWIGGVGLRLGLVESALWDVGPWTLDLGIYRNADISRV